MSSKDYKWQCIQHCGACCRLCPEERQEALDALTPEQQQQYLSMVGEDGWCIHYDSGGRRCRIYEDRPLFCRVSALSALFDVAEDDFDPFAIACCQQQIRSNYGGRSGVMRKFNRSIRQGGTH